MIKRLVDHIILNRRYTGKAKKEIQKEMNKKVP
jgi:hypothetical protein